VFILFVIKWILVFFRKKQKLNFENKLHPWVNGIKVHFIMKSFPLSSYSWAVNRSFFLLLCIVFPLPWNKVHSYPSSMAATKSSQYCFFKQHEHPPWSKRVTPPLCIWFSPVGDKTITCWPSIEYTLWSPILLPWPSFPSSFLSSNHPFNCPLQFS
jgi:hypothetical protein